MDSLIEPRAVVGTFDRVIFKVNQTGSSFQILHNFSERNGPFSLHGLIEASDSYLYGTGNIARSLTWLYLFNPLNLIHRLADI